MPSRIYIVINYIGGTVEKINRIPSSSAGDLFKKKIPQNIELIIQ